jgi:hypothetical protein
MSKTGSGLLLPFAEVGADFTIRSVTFPLTGLIFESFGISSVISDAWHSERFWRFLTSGTAKCLRDSLLPSVMKVLLL